MISIRVRGEANAQGVFDALAGADRGVTWREPFRPTDAHTITVQRLTAEEARATLESLRITGASVKEF